MDTTVASPLLQEHLDRHAARPFAELSSLIGATPVTERSKIEGKEYQIEINVFWDDDAMRAIRLVGSIDDGGWRSLVPLTLTVIVKKPNQSSQPTSLTRRG